MYLYNLTSPTLSLYLPYPHTHTLYMYINQRISLTLYHRRIHPSTYWYLHSLSLSLFLSPSVMLMFVYFVSLSISLFVICPFFLSTCFHINGISRFLHRLGILLSFVCLPTCISSQCLCLHSYAVFLSHPILLLQHSISL